MEPEGTLALEVSLAVSLVVDALLDRWDGRDKTVIQIEDEAEWRALSILAWIFEEEIAKQGYLSNAAEHQEMIRTAKKSLTEYLGQSRKRE